MNVLTSHQKEALDYQSHISLTANAGSGKTFVLAMRYLEIAVAEEVPLRNIAAITFTDKAASELYNKIAEQLDSRIFAGNDSKIIKKLENIRRQLVSANISTIHSFCINILREYPVEAELDANFIPVDERTSNELIELAIEELVKNTLEDPSDAEDLKYLVRIFASKSLFTRELASLIKNRKNVSALAANLYRKNEKQLAEFFYESFSHLLEILFLKNKEKLLKSVEEINKAVLEYQRGNQSAILVSQILNYLITEKDPVKIFILLGKLRQSICTNKGVILTKGYLSRNDRKIVEHSCAYVEGYFKELPVFDTSNHIEIELELARFGRKMVYFFNKADDLYTAKKREAGFLDYEDILLYTQRILENETVKEGLSEKFRYIMIDEYQDTNELQYQIFLPILDHLKKGNLFVVGDEKQSIYMFRDAELEIFDKTKRDMINESEENKLLTLPDSFRMSPNLCLFTNYLFKNLFRNPNPMFNEVEHNDIVCARESADKGKIEILIAGSDNSAEKISEAELVAQRILKLTDDESIAWNDVAILCRKRKSFTVLENAFIKYNIPFSILGGKGFYQKQMIYDFYNYFSFLLDPANDAALVGILRSPFFSLSDAEIYEISLQKKNNFWNKLQLFEENNHRFSEVVELLKENLAIAKTLDITALLRKILYDSDYLAVTASKSTGEQELANINKLIRLTIDFNARGFNTLYDYIDFLKESIEQAEDEAQAAVSDESNSVKIMTLHQAKGLEFPAVFLFKCNEISKTTQAKSKTVVVNKELGLFTKLPVRENYFGEYKSAPIVEINDYISGRKNSAELKRLFYVGITRAKDYLFLSTEYKKSYPGDSFSGMLSEGLGTNINTNSISIESDLVFLKKEGEILFNETSSLHLEIPVIYELENITIPDEQKSDKYLAKTLLIDRIKDQTEGEIISATKLAVYMQCPLKYKLTYELGYLPLYSSFNNWKRDRRNNYEFNDKEIDLYKNEELNAEEKATAGYAAVKGKVIHKILQKDISYDHLMEFIQNEIKNELSIFEYASAVSDLSTEILQDITFFYKSEIYKEIKSFNDYRNEFEVYAKENDYYLYGIIDKLILTGEKAIIVDYKTDNISPDEIGERAQVYLNQLKFYSYIISRFYENINEFELKLIFIKHPGNVVSENPSSGEILSVSRIVSDMMRDIRDQKYLSNTKHCSKCNYSLNFNRCILNTNNK